jgi:hypothetical protein
MKKKLILITAAFTIILSSCQKQPSADFTTDKSQYQGGDVVMLTSTSVDAKSYKWTLPDGQTSSKSNLNYTLASNQGDATLTFKLEAISKNGKKTDDATKIITVKAASGQALIWTSNSSADPISVYIDDISVGTITAYYNSAPECGSMGCVTANLKVGDHLVDATDGYDTWSGTVTVTKNGCSKFNLQ